MISEVKNAKVPSDQCLVNQAFSLSVKEFICKYHSKAKEILKAINFRQFQLNAKNYEENWK